MDRGLVLIEESDDHRRLLSEAVEHAVGAGADLVLLTTMTEKQFEDDAETLESIGRSENTNYDSNTVLDGAVADIEAFAGDHIPDDVESTVVARMTDRPAKALLDVADKRDCDHVFVLGERRSPTGKALFGDVAQQVALNFDGYVTLSTR
ncbi:universal stress protein [Haloarchaeobius sp. DYHT-AS-18]|uniref:universal stress protein n=1 Tax=Haloarchaeobius sp. DYHT-AS-18 TaxID=3446117 RepID=UPI003EBE89CC